MDEILRAIAELRKLGATAVTVRVGDIKVGASFDAPAQDAVSHPIGFQDEEEED